MADVVVYCSADGRRYVAAFDDALVSWPAERDGWARREPATDSDVIAGNELPPMLARLALRLSGAPTDVE